MHRRKFLTASSAVTIGVLAGCSIPGGGGEEDEGDGGDDGGGEDGEESGDSEEGGDDEGSLNRLD